jgi:hypothetical protein
MATLKSKKVIPIKSAQIARKCSDCLHFQNVAKFEQPCKKMGIKGYSVAPDCFSPNVYALTKKNPDALFQLGVMLKDFDASDVRVLMSLLKLSVNLDKHYNLRFGQPVFFCLGGRDYLSNYFRGFVIGAANIGTMQLFVTSDMNRKQRGQPATVALMPDSVLTVSAFKKRKAELIKAGKLNDPKPLFNTTVPKESPVEHVPPTLESAPAEWFDKTESKARIKKDRSLIVKEDGALVFKV